MIRLGRTEDGRLILGSNEPFPADVAHVEYYREQKLFNLVLERSPENAGGDGREESILMPCELDERTAAIVRASPNVMVIAMAETGAPAYGYAVPLIQIGV